MSPTHFRVNPHSIVAWMTRKSLLEARVWIHSEMRRWHEHTVKCTVQISTQNTAQSFDQFGQMFECSFKNYVVLGSNPVAVTLPSDFAPASSKEFVDIQATIDCGFTMKCVCDMTRTYSQMHRTDKYSEQSSIIWSVWPNGWVFVYELSGSGFECSCSHLKANNSFFSKKKNK